MPRDQSGFIFFNLWALSQKAADVWDFQVFSQTFFELRFSLGNEGRDGKNLNSQTWPGTTRRPSPRHLQPSYSGKKESVSCAVKKEREHQTKKRRQPRCLSMFQGTARRGFPKNFNLFPSLASEQNWRLKGPNRPLKRANSALFFKRKKMQKKGTTGALNSPQTGTHQPQTGTKSGL